MSEVSQLHLTRSRGASIAMLCPGQAYPVPTFRYDRLRPSPPYPRLHRLEYVSVCRPAGRGVCLVLGSGDDGVGSGAGAGSGPAQGLGWAAVVRWVTVARRRVVTEPVAATAPSVMSLPDEQHQTADRAMTLLCPSQAYPVPTFRYGTGSLLRSMDSG